MRFLADILTSLMMTVHPLLDRQVNYNILCTVMSWFDFFRSLVNTRLCPFSFVEDTEDITSQLLSSLAKFDKHATSAHCARA